MREPERAETTLAIPSSPNLTSDLKYTTRVPVAELELAAIIVCWLIIAAFVSRQKFRSVMVIYVLGCGTGWLGQYVLGAELNRYSANITLYAGYVSVAVILAWGTGLSTMWGLHLGMARWFRLRPNVLLFVVAAVPVMTILEAIGSNVIRMKLHNHQQYTPLMPALNSMHAPPWLFGYYGIVAIVFYALLMILRIHTGVWPANRNWGRAFRPSAVPPAQQPAPIEDFGKVE